MSIKDFINRLLENKIVDKQLIETVLENAGELFDDYMSVITIKEKKNEIVAYSDIVCIEIRDSESIVSTKTQGFISMLRQESVLQIAEKLNFQKCDKSTFINMKELKKINSVLGIVLFDNVSSIKEAKVKGYTSIYIHNRYITLFKDFLGIANDLSYRPVLKNNKIIFKRNVADEIF